MSFKLLRFSCKLDVIFLTFHTSEKRQKNTFQFLNKFSFGLAIKKFLFATDGRLEKVSSEEFRI